MVLVTMVVMHVVLMFMAVAVSIVNMSSGMPGFLLRPEFLAWHVLFAIYPDVDLRRGNTAANHAGNLESCAQVQSFDCLCQQLRRDSGVDKGAKEHIAGNAGKTFEIGDARHGVSRWSIVVGHWQFGRGLVRLPETFSLRTANDRTLQPIFHHRERLESRQTSRHRSV